MTYMQGSIAKLTHKEVDLVDPRNLAYDFNYPISHKHSIRHTKPWRLTTIKSETYMDTELCHIDNFCGYQVSVVKRNDVLPEEKFFEAYRDSDITSHVRIGSIQMYVSNEKLAKRKRDAIREKHRDELFQEE